MPTDLNPAESCGSAESNSEDLQSQFRNVLVALPQPIPANRYVVSEQHFVIRLRTAEVNLTAKLQMQHFLKQLRIKFSTDFSSSEIATADF
jgi:hypothetical protein